MTTIGGEQVADIDPVVATMVERIADRFDPERILFFGSRARGDTPPRRPQRKEIVRTSP